MTIASFHAKRLQQRVRVARQLLKRKLILARFGRFAEADLIRRNDAIASSRQRNDGRLPSSSANLAVQQHYRPAVGVGRFGGRTVKIRHLQPLPLRLELKALLRPRIFESFQFRTVRRTIFLRAERCDCEGCEQQWRA